MRTLFSLFLLDLSEPGAQETTSSFWKHTPLSTSLTMYCLGFPSTSLLTLFHRLLFFPPPYKGWNSSQLYLWPHLPLFFFFSISDLIIPMALSISYIHKSQRYMYSPHLSFEFQTQIFHCLPISLTEYLMFISKVIFNIQHGTAYFLFILPSLFSITPTFSIMAAMKMLLPDI